MQYFLACGIALHFVDTRMAAATPYLCPSTFPLSAFRHKSLDDCVSNNYPYPRGLADTGQHFGCWHCIFTIWLWLKVRKVKLYTEVRVGSKDGYNKNISWTQPISSMLVICLTNLTTCYLYRIIIHLLWGKKQNKNAQGRFLCSLYRIRSVAKNRLSHYSQIYSQDES